MKFAIASGKGGTGKTTVSVNLYYFLIKYFEKKVFLVDCDVEEPNVKLFFPEAKKVTEKEVFQLIPEIDTAKCTFCKKCVDWCEFNAITLIKNHHFAQVNSDLCHSCGACIVACEFDAIEEKKQSLGLITHFNSGIGNGIIEGRLKVGSAMQTSLIKEVKKEVSNGDSIILLDAPPGTSCPVVETVADADYVILVTEPTPFGLHDLKITIELLNNLQKSYGVIINKAGLGTNEVNGYLKENNIELLGEIPFQEKYAVQYSSGNILKDIPLEIEKVYREIIANLYTKSTVR